MNDLIELYIKELKDSYEFKRLLELKDIINNKYSKQIISLKTKEAKYLEAKEYKDYYPNFIEIQNGFKEAKKELYSKEEVKEYFKLERMIQESLDKDINSLMESISNKFKTKNIISIF